MRSRSKGSSPRNMAAISVSISALVTPPPSVSPRPRSPSSVSIWMTSRVQSALAPPDQRIGATKGMLTISTLIFAIFIAGSYGKNGSAIVSGVPVLHLGLFLRLHPPTPSRPLDAGLSHVGNELKEEVVVPSCSFEFLAHGYAVGMGSNDIESEATQDGQVFRPVVFSGATGILVEDDVEDPVEAIFDAPMGTDDLQQALRRHVGGEEEVADHGFVCGLALNSSVCGDAGEGDDAGELVGRGDAGIADDDGRTFFFSIVGGGFERLCCAAGPAGASKPPDHGFEQLALVGLERQNEVAAASEHGRGEGSIAMLGIGGDGAALQREHRQHLQGALGFVAPRCLARGQDHTRRAGKDIDKMHRCGGLAALVSTPQSLAIDGHNAAEVDLVGGSKGGHETTEDALEANRVELPKDPAEGIVAWRPILQPQELAKQLFLRRCEHRHVGRALSPRQHRGQGDKQDLDQIVHRIGRPRIGQLPEDIDEFLHPTPLSQWESSSESISRPNAIPNLFSHAIPLPCGGGLGWGVLQYLIRTR